jgi:glycosyltransferase involved in cell wall biosynthesis
LVAPSLSILGGQSVQAERLVRGFERQKTVELRLCAINSPLPTSIQFLGKVKYLRTLATLAVFFVRALFAIRRSDVVHVFTPSYYSYLLGPLQALLIARVLGRGSVLHYHSGEALDHLAHWPLSRRTIATLPGRVVVPSGYLVEVFGRFGIAAVAIPNNIELELLPFLKRENFQPRFLSNRNLEAMYGVDCTLRAFRLIQDKIPSASLVIVGDGRNRQSLVKLAEELGLENVTFEGYVAPGAMRRYYDGADFFINCSRIDNQPLSIIEAFASGIAVISTRAGGIPWLVSDKVTGSLAAIDDHQEIARLALSLLACPDRAQSMVEAARIECEGRYSFASVRQLWERLYWSVARAGDTIKDVNIGVTSP